MIARCAKSRGLLPLGYERFPDQPTTSDWWAFIAGLSIPSLGLMGIAAWSASQGEIGGAVGAAVLGGVAFLVLVAPKIVLLIRMRRRSRGAPPPSV
ncbi:hypothetical protein [Nocardiopsis sp. MG754419]|uniref:hypothetical protein n=1 Tax=Nocardiopsis sp. MG754419 TaxID=2259865 RepID=UPI001BAA5998|nr:hypothetical protein [Nocardiopsis sp. MG754419]MBR8745205.1 hypothetical protein [Nocardiopsis sp. MG754419]